MCRGDPENSGLTVPEKGWPGCTAHTNHSAEENVPRCLSHPPTRSPGQSELWLGFFPKVLWQTNSAVNHAVLAAWLAFSAKQPLLANLTAVRRWSGGIREDRVCVCVCLTKTEGELGSSSDFSVFLH